MDQQFADYVAVRWPSLVRYATVVTGDRHEAEELVQAALVRVTVRWRLLRDRDDLDAYVRTAIVRGHLNTRRRLRRHRCRAVDQQAVVAGEMDDAGRAIDVRRALAALPPRQRATLVLRYLDDLSEAQTAEALGCSVGTVKSQTSKALASLRRTFPHLSDREDSP